VNDPLKIKRRRFRAWRKAKRLRRETRYYKRKFTALGLSVPDDVDIRRKITKAFGNIRSRVNGGLRILAIYHNYNWENESLKPSLQCFGSVRHIDWPGQSERKEMCRGIAVKRKLSHVLVDKVEKWIEKDAVNVIFTYLSGENITGDAVERLTALGVPVVNLCLNDKDDFIGKIKNGQATG
jgi:hypothetical protein